MRLIDIKQTHKKAVVTVVAVVLSLCLLLSVCLYMSRGWIRSQLIPSYANRFYRPSADRAFADTFPLITDQLQALGFSFPTHRNKAQCDIGDVTFDFFSETVVCGTGISNIPKPLTSAFVSNWQQHSPAFEQYLFAHGWKKQYLASQPIADIISINSTASITVNYSKQVASGVYCGLSVAYTPNLRNSSDPNQLTANESCYHNLVIFGGSNG